MCKFHSLNVLYIIYICIHMRMVAEGKFEVAEKEMAESMRDLKRFEEFM